MAQVFKLAELVGRRPIGNVRLLAGGYRLRFQRHGQMHTAPEVYLSRSDAERALWAMTLDGRADCNHDRRYRALVLLATGCYSVHLTAAPNSITRSLPVRNLLFC